MPAAGDRRQTETDPGGAESDAALADEALDLLFVGQVRLGIVRAPASGRLSGRTIPGGDCATSRGPAG